MPGTPWETELPFVFRRDYADLEFPDMQIDPYLRERGLVVLYGPPYSGKTFLALAWATQIAYRVSWVAGGHYKDGPWKTVYVTGEGISGFGLRVRAAMDYYIPDYLPPVRPELEDQMAILPRQFAIPHSTEAAQLVETVRNNEVRLVVLDTLSRYMRGDENNQEDMREFVNFCGDLQDAGATVVVVHHSPKGDKRDMRGSSVLHGAADIAIAMERQGDAPNYHYHVTSEKDKEGEGFPPRDLVLTSVEVPWLPDDPTDTRTHLNGAAFELKTLGTTAVGVDWELRFAEYFEAVGVVRTKTSAIKGGTRMKGDAKMIRRKWDEFASLGWICQTESGHEWTGPDTAKEL